MSVTSLCNRVLQLQRPTFTDARGVQGPSVYTVVSGAEEVPCSIQPARPNTVELYRQRRMQVSHSVYFDYDWKVYLGDRFVEIDSGRVFVVLGWHNSLELDDCWVADCDEQRVPLA